MAKRHSLVDVSTPLPCKKPCVTDWNLCVLCQKDTKTGLECPARSHKAPIGSGYKSLSEHLAQFQMHGCMPLEIDIKRLDDGDGIEADEPAGFATLHNASTYDIDIKVRRCALELEDTSLLAN